MGNFKEHTVNQRFNKVYSWLEKENLIKGKSDIAKKLGTYNHVINSILKGQRNITIDQLQKLFEEFPINANYIFGTSEEMLIPHSDQAGDIPAHSKDDSIPGGRANITLVPEPALAGYALESQKEGYLDDLQKFSVPYLEGQLIAFEINGDSMHPTITDGDIVICEKIERGQPLRDNHVYVIVTDVVVAKRIQQLKKGNKTTQLRLISDNHTVYQPYEVELEDIREVLKVKCRLTSHAVR
jgi:transcriptional regulator with XRE-family HTH domain